MYVFACGCMWVSVRAYARLRRLHVRSVVGQGVQRPSSQARCLPFPPLPPSLFLLRFPPPLPSVSSAASSSASAMSRTRRGSYSELGQPKPQTLNPELDCVERHDIEGLHHLAHSVAHHGYIWRLVKHRRRLACWMNPICHLVLILVFIAARCRVRRHWNAPLRVSAPESHADI